MLAPNPIPLAKGHAPGGKCQALVLYPHYGGKSRKRAINEEPYSASNPCASKRSGQGPPYLGFYQREDCLKKGHKARFRGPRAASASWNEFGAYTVCCDVVLLPGTASYLHACSQHRSSCGNTCFSVPILIRSTTTTNFTKCREMMDISDSVNIDVVTANEPSM